MKGMTEYQGTRIMAEVVVVQAWQIISFGLLGLILWRVW